MPPYALLKACALINPVALPVLPLPPYRPAESVQCTRRSVFIPDAKCSVGCKAGFVFHHSSEDIEDPHGNRFLTSALNNEGKVGGGRVRHRFYL